MAEENRQDETIPDLEAAHPDLRELGEIIRAYSAATAELQQSHQLLQQQVMQLTGELQRKNQELSDTVTQVSALKNYLAGIIQSSADGIIAIDLRRRVMAWNPAANTLADIAGEIPENPEGLFIMDVLQGSCREFAMMLMRAMQENRAYSGVEMRLTDKSGRTRYFSASASPVRNVAENGDAQTVGAVQIFSELTEIRELEERANRHDRLAALGEMAAGVAHEIRNPLGGIELYASSLRRKFSDDSKEHATCGKIIAAATRLNRIVTDMLNFTRGKAPQMRPSPVQQVVKGAVDMAARELAQKDIAVDFQFENVDAPWMMDPDQMIQAGLNVILNAAQVMEPGGRITIAASVEPRSGTRFGRIDFIDTGPGIPESAKSKLFDPFFTLRKDGTGLGLAIVHKILQDHGGGIDVGDNQPHGARITFRLPIDPTLSHM